MSIDTPDTALKNPEADQYSQYRTLSFPAIVTFVLGMLAIPCGLVASYNPFMLLLPFLGLVFGIYTAFRLKKRRDEFTGHGLAKTGLILSLLFLVLGTVQASYVYATEVPEGFIRVKFDSLQPDPKYPQSPVPPLAGDLDQQKVFIKGFVYPDEQLGNIKRFVLVPDMGTCCFGGQPKLTDMIQVTLADPNRLKYSMFRRSLAGTFRLGSSQAAKVGNVVYHLEEAEVRK